MISIKRLKTFGVTQELSKKYWSFNQYKGYRDSDISNQFFKQHTIKKNHFLNQNIFSGSVHTISKKLMNHIAIRIHYFLSNKPSESLKDVAKVAMILHDKDTKINSLDKTVLKHPHLHIFCKLNHRVTLSKISKIVGVNPQYIDFGRGRYASENMQAYLIHADDNRKYQYNPHDVHTFNTYNYVMYYKSHIHKWKLSQAHQSKMRHKINRDWLIKTVQSGIIPDKFTLLKNSKLAPIYADNMKDVNIAFQYAMEHKSVLTQEDLDHHQFLKTIIFIDGAPGSGKTIFGKHLIKMIKKQIASCLHKYWTVYDAATLNPFDDYEGQDIVFLDDARHQTMASTDWLKLMDPVTIPRLSARYHNKYLSCRVIIITSYMNPFNLFGYKNSEDISQFIRRISRIVHIYHYKNSSKYRHNYDIRKASLMKIYKIANTHNKDKYIAKKIKDGGLNQICKSLVKLIIKNNKPGTHIPKDKPLL